MLKVLAIAAQVALLLYIAYWLITALWGWPSPASAGVASRFRRFRVVVAAHDEAAVIGGVVTDLMAQHYPGDHVRVVVVADRCTDDTATVARGAGAEVAERVAGPGGKGAALAWHLAADPLLDGEALVVLDADTRVPPELLETFNAAIEAGARALQAYLDVANPDGSSLATASALSYWASNRMVQLARANLGWPVDLGGTGMCFTQDALDAAGGFGETLAEDQELGARLALAGINPTWLHDLRIQDEKPEGAAVAVRQRARWASGRRQVARRYAGRLAGAGVRRRAPGLFDLALRLVQPGRMFVALLTAVLAVVAALADTGWLLPWWVWAVAALIQVLAPVPFLARDGVPGRYLVRYPFLLILVLLWIPIRLVSRLRSGWYHTPRRDSGKSS
jgi:cellulose synthase/poly-beta-1,6-N-acetylglucosamine synthase-like glycosyltransferase